MNKMDSKEINADITDEKKMKECPECGNLIVQVAVKCKYCGTLLDEQNVKNTDSKLYPKENVISDCNDESNILYDSDQKEDDVEVIELENQEEINNQSNYNKRIGRLGYFKRQFGLSLIFMPLAFFLGLIHPAGRVIISIVWFIGTYQIVIGRLFDLNRPKKYYWFLWLPFYNFYFMFYLLFKKGSIGANIYGDDPTVK